MTAPKYSYLPTLFRSIVLLEFFFACFIVLETESFATSPPSYESLPLGANKSDDPHLSLPSGIVGPAPHLTAQRVGDPAQVIIRAVHPSGPAAQTGIKYGEAILAVNGQSIVGKTYQEVVSLIRGEIGSSVQLDLRGPQGERTLTVVRVNENILMEQTPQTM